MLRNEGCDVVDLAFDDSPAIELGVVLLDLLHSEPRCVLIFLLEVLFIELGEEFLLLALLLLLKGLRALILTFELLNHDLGSGSRTLVFEELDVIRMLILLL